MSILDVTVTKGALVTGSYNLGSVEVTTGTTSYANPDMVFGAEATVDKDGKVTTTQSTSFVGVKLAAGQAMSGDPGTVVRIPVMAGSTPVWGYSVVVNIDFGLQTIDDLEVTTPSAVTFAPGTIYKIPVSISSDPQQPLYAVWGYDGNSDTNQVMCADFNPRSSLYWNFIDYGGGDAAQYSFAKESMVVTTDTPNSTSNWALYQPITLQEGSRYKISPIFYTAGNGQVAGAVVAVFLSPTLPQGSINNSQWQEGGPNPGKDVFNLAIDTWPNNQGSNLGAGGWEGGDTPMIWNVTWGYGICCNKPVAGVDATATQEGQFVAPFSQGYLVILFQTDHCSLGTLTFKNLYLNPVP